MKRVLFVGGGSVGHIAPAVAVAQELRRQCEDIGIHFVCSEKHEDQEFLKKEQYEFTAIGAPRMGFGFGFGFVKAWIQSKKILKKFKPDVVFSKGGYVSVIPCLSAYIQGVPIILHESDAVLGRANWIISKIAKHICFGFPISYKLPNYAKATKGTQATSCYTGNPIRTEVTQGSREEGLRITGFTGSKPVLLVIGGSQGSVTLNETIWNKLEEILEIVNVVHITGIGKTHRSPLTAHRSKYWYTEFANEELSHIYAIADIAISRAGASVIAELHANSIPTILVPLRGVGHDHQYKNALLMKEKDGFWHIEEEELHQNLLQTIQQILQKGYVKKPHTDQKNASLEITKVIRKYLV
jgi:UDP-N-acetylglucosamine--N-acetylmuramyl-(pentapeptide) pyrophosphoryl-undecaprenol N-acetylglucosamine transferase